MTLKLIKNAGFLKINYTYIVVIAIVILSAILNVKTVPVAPSPVIFYQPPHIQTQGFKFLNIPFVGNPNTPSSSEDQGFTLNFLRIHQLKPFIFQVAVSLTGIGYVHRSLLISSKSLILLNVTTHLNTGFMVRGYVQHKTNYLHLQGRYIAYNANYETDFYFENQLVAVPVPINFILYRIQKINKPYPSASFGTGYNMLFLLNGFDIVIGNGLSRLQLYVNVIPSSTNYQVQIRGHSCFINRVYYSVIYYKTDLDYSLSPLFKQTKLFHITYNNCPGTLPDGSCLIYQPNNSMVTTQSFSVFDSNFIMGVIYSSPTYAHDFEIRYNSGKIQIYRKQNNGVDYRGFIFFGYKCQDGFYFDTTLQTCDICPQKCLSCTSLQCLYCDIDHVLSSDGKSCNPIYFPPADMMGNCIQFQNKADLFTCVFCNITRKLYINQKTAKCECKNGHFFNSTSQMCEDICGDGILIQEQCDDGNLINNDGCNSTCKIQVGFNCVTNITPTVCKSALQLKYMIEMIQKIQDQDAGLIVLSPTVFNMPFDVIKQNFYTSNQFLTHLNFILILKNNTVELPYALDFEFQKIENNKIYLSFRYNFTVQKLNARIYLNYEFTKYLPTNQTLDFQLTGMNGKFEYTSFFQAYSTVSKGIQIATIFGMLSLAVGLILPKFIGIETIVTLQLIFYSQILIYQPQYWPIGFTYLKYLKISAGYNEFIFLTSYFQLTNITKRFSIINLKKTIIQNFNLNFFIIMLFALTFYLAALIRSKKETQIQIYIKENKILDAYRNFTVKKMMNKFRIPLRINEVMYWIVSQLCIWSILPIISSIGAEFMIQNSMIILRKQKYDSLLLSLRGVEFFIILFVVLSVVLNHFKNAFLSRRTLKKIQQRPEELFYKRLLFIYLFIMGGLIFFFNDVKFGYIPISVIVLILHTIYAISLLFIQPYKQSLRIHAFTLYMNQVLYGVFLIVINFINLLSQLNQLIILYIGYAITVWIAFLILMTFVRLYYEIRYGEALQKQIQAQRKKAEQAQEKKNKQKLQKKIDKLQKEAKNKITKLQQKRDMNSYLLETQQKQQQKKNLLEWLQGKNWEQEEKERYFFKEYHQKPLEWIQNKESEELKKRIANFQLRKKTDQEKKKTRKQDPQYTEVTNKLRESLKNKKELLKSFKKEAKRKKEQNKWIQPKY